MLSILLREIRTRLDLIQRKLSFEGWNHYPLFATKQGAGRAALLGTVLGCLLGIHACGFVVLSAWEWLSPSDHNPRLQMAWQWCGYACALAIFHLLEYFTTALCNPTEASSDSFLVNHSASYTAAALTSWTEFAVRLVWLPHCNVPYRVVYMGLGMVMLAQFIRSLAMITAGKSFNHLIQITKKDTHVLITHGIYRIFRHPSYVGFYYWSIGMQLILGNMLHAALFSVVSWSFFHRRIAYEEESLCRLFPDQYPAYVARTWMGIPFIFSKVAAPRQR